MTATLTNRASTTLAVAVLTTDTTLTVTSGTGTLFPSTAAGQFFPVVLSPAAGGPLYEVAYCTSRAGDVLTITRAQEGTAAGAWAVGDYAECSATAGVLGLYAQYQQQVGLPSYAYAMLPVSPNTGDQVVVTDAQVSTYGAVISVGGGANEVKAVRLAGQWKIG